LKEKLSLDHIVTRIVSVVDIPESILSETIEEWELALPKHISLSYLPVGTRVKLRLTASGTSGIAECRTGNEITKLFP
jgi:nicotinamide-nucleotide amidase